jgi:hypothetical protein
MAKGQSENTVPEIDMSFFSWVTNTHTVLHWPLMILSVAGLLVAGAFAEIAPRKSLEILDTNAGMILFFIVPLLFAIIIDWPTGLLAAVVSLIVFARLQKQDSSEGFTDSNTKIISNPHRWFIERILGERPVAISSDRILTSAVQDPDIRTSSSSSMSTTQTDNSQFSHK